MEASVVREGIDAASVCVRRGDAASARVREERRRGFGVRREEEDEMRKVSVGCGANGPEQVSGARLLGRIEWAGRKKEPEILSLYY
jgi:hypothetical protein